MKTILPFIVCLGFGVPLQGQAIPNETIQNLDRTLRQKIENQEYCGIYCIVAQNDRLLLSQGYGKRDATLDAPPAADTYYRMASMTKPIAALAVLLLCADQNISLDSPLSRWLDFVPTDSVTLRHLLSHSSGWGDTWNAGALAPAYAAVLDQSYPDLEQFSKHYLQLPRIGPPGTGWYYGSGPDVMAYWLERVSGMPFTEYVRKNIFDPLGMTHSTYRFPNDDNCAYFHEKDNTGAWRKKVKNNQSIFVGSGSLVSTPGDYFRFCQMLLQDGKLEGKRLFPKKIIRQMRQVAVGRQGNIIPWQPGYGFGLGLSVRVDDAQAKMSGTLGDFGWFGFLGTSFWVDPKRKIVGLVLTQGPYDEYKLNQDVRAVVYGK